MAFFAFIIAELVCFSSNINVVFQRWLSIICLCFLVQLPFIDWLPAQELNAEQAASLIEPPYQLGEAIEPGVWEMKNLDGRSSGFAFETLPLAPLPGFSGAPINLFVMITDEGKFLGAELISHNEPIFVSGLGEAAFQKFISQYKGHSINDSLVVGVPYGGKSEGSSLVYLEGVTKATASVRIAHESILGAVFAVAKQKHGNFGAGRRVEPNYELNYNLSWKDLVTKGVAKRHLVTNAEVNKAFADTIWEDDDPIAQENPNGIYLDLWIVDIAAPAIAKAVLSPDTFEELRAFQEISTDDEPILLIDNGRHGLVGEDFVRNTSPDLISIKQDGLPLALRDSDLDVTLAQNVSGEYAMIFRTDRRLGFDPTRPWSLTLRAIREHGSFRPEIGTTDLTFQHSTDARFYIIQETEKPKPVWLQAIEQRRSDLIFLSLASLALLGVMIFRMRWLSSHRNYLAIRLAILAFVVCFIGWWGQGQLSVATVIGVIRSIKEGQSLSFLFYDPFSLLLWIVVFISFFLWGRGLFCGWLCPFGAMQEFSNWVGKKLGLRQITLSERWEFLFSKFKYIILFAMIGSIWLRPEFNDMLIEVEPFKTAVTTYFVREWYFVFYAIGLLLLSMVIFKGFCRFICPLGAFMAIGGLFRLNNWIDRRKECGSPCQLCKVKCRYGAIEKSGKIRYDECFQCLDCVSIFEDENRCVPLVLTARGKTL